MRRLLISFVSLVVALCLLAPAALAGNTGEGLYGPANDKVVTNAGFIIIATFPLIILMMSLLQWRLEKRKQARLAASRARSASADWRGGW